VTERPKRDALGPGGLLLSALLVAGAAMLVVTILVAIVSRDSGWDARYAYLGASEAVLDGRSPYPGVDEVSLRADKVYVYPPQLAFAYAPLTAVPVEVAVGIAGIASLAAILAALAVVGVRDWRCYAAVLVWAPAWNAIDTANVSAGLALLVGVIWRYRATLWPLVAALGLAVSLKLFLWPLLMWTGLFRGLRTAVLAAVSAVAITLVAWAPIRFADFTDYPRLLSKLADVQAAKSFSFVGSADALGLGTSFGRAAMVLVGGALLLGCVRFARERDERRSFTCAVAAAIVLTPVLWQHYLVLLVVPVALARPRFSAIWLLPALLWLVPRVPDTGGYLRVGPLLVCALMVGLLLVEPRRLAVAVRPT
jgi:hypothetical protein